MPVTVKTEKADDGYSGTDSVSNGGLEQSANGDPASTSKDSSPVLHVVLQELSNLKEQIARQDAAHQQQLQQQTANAVITRDQIVGELQSLMNKSTAAAPESRASSSSSSVVVKREKTNSDRGHDNNNSDLNKDKLWELYLAGKVKVLTDEDAGSECGSTTASTASGRNGPEILAEKRGSSVGKAVKKEMKRDPGDEGDERLKTLGFSDDWSPVWEGNTLAAILCRVCKSQGKEPAPIKGTPVDKLKNFGEQHLVFAHGRAPVGSKFQVGPRPFQCPTCSLYFAGDNLLKKHRPKCEEEGGDKRSTRQCKIELKRIDTISDGNVSESSDGGRNKRKHQDDEDDSKVKKRGRPRASTGVAKVKAEPVEDSVLGGYDAGDEDQDSAIASKPKADKPKAKKPTSKDKEEDDIVDLPHSLGNKWLDGKQLEMWGCFPCPLCSTRALAKPIFIEDHVAGTHFKQSRYSCKICKDNGEEYKRAHKGPLEDHIKKEHSMQWNRREKLGLKLILEGPLCRDAVNTMRLFFKMFPKKEEKDKEPPKNKKYLPKKQTSSSDCNTKKSKCPECDQKFYTSEERTLIDHIMWRHRDKPRYHCGHCGVDDQGKYKTSFGMVAGFEDHCKKEHQMNKNDWLQLLFMKVDKVPEELAKQYYIDDDEYQELHKGAVVVSDVEEDEVDKKEVQEVPPEKIPDMKVGFRKKEMFLVCTKCDNFELSSRELYIADKIKTHVNTHKNVPAA